MIEGGSRSSAPDEFFTLKQTLEHHAADPTVAAMLVLFLLSGDFYDRAGRMA